MSGKQALAALIVLLLCGGLSGCSHPWVSKRPSAPSLAVDAGAPRSPLAPPEVKPSPWERLKGLFVSKKDSSAKPKAAKDSISLDKKPKPNPELLCALGRLHEQARNPKAAEKQYLAALKMDAKYVPAHLALARLYDRQNRFAQAVHHYRQAVALQPKNPALHNDLGVCLARAGQMQPAAQALGRAVELAPKEPRYRNNLATVLVHLGQTQQALQQLQAVHPPDVAAYNLGYLLAQAGKQAEAARYFQMALQANPRMEPARAWLAHLQQASRAVATRPAAAPRYGQQPAVGQAPAAAAPGR